MWFSGPVAEFHNQAFLLSCLYLNIESSGRSWEWSTWCFTAVLQHIRFSAWWAETTKQWGCQKLCTTAAEGFWAQRDVEAPTSLPRLPTSHPPPPGKVALSVAHSGQRRPRDSDPALPFAEREPAAGEGGPKLLKRGLAATRNSRPRLSPRETGTEQPVGRSRLFSCPKGPGSKDRAGRLRGAGQVYGGGLGGAGSRGEEDGGRGGKWRSGGGCQRSWGTASRTSWGPREAVEPPSPRVGGGAPTATTHSSRRQTTHSRRRQQNQMGKSARTVREQRRSERPHLLKTPGGRGLWAPPLPRPAPPGWFLDPLRRAGGVWRGGCSQLRFGVGTERQRAESRLFLLFPARLASSHVPALPGLPPHGTRQFPEAVRKGDFLNLQRDPAQTLSRRGIAPAAQNRTLPRGRQFSFRREQSKVEEAPTSRESAKSGLSATLSLALSL